MKIKIVAYKFDNDEWVQIAENEMDVVPTEES